VLQTDTHSLILDTSLALCDPRTEDNGQITTLEDSDENTTGYSYISPRTTNPLRRGEQLHSWALGTLLLHWVADPLLLLAVVE
jgi:hypothetical protein